MDVFEVQRVGEQKSCETPVWGPCGASVLHIARVCLTSRAQFHRHQALSHWSGNRLTKRCSAVSVLDKTGTTDGHPGFDSGLFRFSRLSCCSGKNTHTHFSDRRVDGVIRRGQSSRTVKLVASVHAALMHRRRDDVTLSPFPVL